MRRQHEQARVVHAHALRQHEVGRMIRVERPLLGEPVAIVAGRFVAVMAVGNEQRLGVHDRGDVGDHLDVGDRPHAMDDAQMVGRRERRLPVDGFFEQVLGGVFGIGIEAKNLAEVGAAGFGQQQPVLLGAASASLRADRFCPRQTAPGARGDMKPRRVTRLAAVLEGLVIDVEGRIGIDLHHAFLPPVLQEFAGPRVLVRLLVVARLFAVELQADEVGRVLFVDERVTPREARAKEIA